MSATRVRWWVLALLSLVIAGNYYAYDSIAPVADLLRSARGFTQSQIGLLNAVFSIPNILLALAGGFGVFSLSQHFRHRVFPGRQGA